MFTSVKLRMNVVGSVLTIPSAQVQRLGIEHYEIGNPPQSTPAGVALPVGQPFRLVGLDDDGTYVTRTLEFIGVSTAWKTHFQNGVTLLLPMQVGGRRENLTIFLEAKERTLARPVALLKRAARAAAKALTFVLLALYSAFRLALRGSAGVHARNGV
jgi:hypothetical protein